MNGRFFPRDEYFMRLAIREAERALTYHDVPIGAVVVQDGEIVATAHNERELRNDPTGHAEILALRVLPKEGGRAVKCGGLENRFGGDSSDEGSNPSPSVV